MLPQPLVVRVDEHEDRHRRCHPLQPRTTRGCYSASALPYSASRSPAFRFLALVPAAPDEMAGAADDDEAAPPPPPVPVLPVSRTGLPMPQTFRIRAGDAENGFRGGEGLTMLKTRVIFLILSWYSFVAWYGFFTSSWISFAAYGSPSLPNRASSEHGSTHRLSSHGPGTGAGRSASESMLSESETTRGSSSTSRGRRLAYFPLTRVLETRLAIRSRTFSALATARSTVAFAYNSANPVATVIEPRKRLVEIEEMSCEQIRSYCPKYFLNS